MSGFLSRRESMMDLRRKLLGIAYLPTHYLLAIGRVPPPLVQRW
jgi:hypothetical protein